MKTEFITKLISVRPIVSRKSKDKMASASSLLSKSCMSTRHNINLSKTLEKRSLENVVPSLEDSAIQNKAEKGIKMNAEYLPPSPDI